MFERELSTDDGVVCYWVSSNGDCAPQLVFLPGLTADHRLFDKQIEHFESQANCLVWDPPSHGLSRPFKLDWSMDDLARLLRAVLQREGFAHPVLVGQSMGGYVAQAYIDLYPGETAGFISIDSCPLQRAYYTAAELWALKRTRAIYQPIPWKILLDIGSRGCATSAYGQELMRRMMGDYSKREYIDLAVCGYGALAEAVLADRPYRIDCPALLVCGERDAAGSARRYNRAWAKRTKLSVAWIEGAGHNSNTDAPEYVNRLIERFVDKLGPSSTLSHAATGMQPEAAR